MYEKMSLVIWINFKSIILDHCWTKMWLCCELLWFVLPLNVAGVMKPTIYTFLRYNRRYVAENVQRFCPWRLCFYPFERHQTADVFHFLVTTWEFLDGKRHWLDDRPKNGTFCFRLFQLPIRPWLLICDLFVPLGRRYTAMKVPVSLDPDLPVKHLPILSAIYLMAQVLYSYCLDLPCLIPAKLILLFPLVFESAAAVIILDNDIFSKFYDFMLIQNAWKIRKKNGVLLRLWNVIVWHKRLEKIWKKICILLN